MTATPVGTARSGRASMPTAPPDSTSSRFSRALRSMTWDGHEEAEFTGYMQAMLGGQLTRDGYAAMVAQHYFAYLVIEEASEAMRNDPVAAPFISDGLTRVPALEADLTFLLGDDWADRIEPNKATREYCARLREVCFGWPGGFVAHHYTRYLGDLSGGQVIKAAAERAYRLPDDQGVQFYVFSDIANHRDFKVRYRALLDEAPWDAAEQQRVIAETMLAYRLNTKVLAELGRDSSRYLAG